MVTYQLISGYKTAMNVILFSSLLLQCTEPWLPYLPLLGAGVPASLHDEIWLTAAPMN